MQPGSLIVVTCMERLIIVAVKSLSHVQFFATPWTATHSASLSISSSQSLLKLMSIELVMPSNHLILCHPLLFLPSIFASIKVFSKESSLHFRWPEYWNFSFSISPSCEYSGLISFRIGWFDLLAVQWTIYLSIYLSIWTVSWEEVIGHWNCTAWLPGPSRTEYSLLLMLFGDPPFWYLLSFTVLLTSLIFTCLPPFLKIASLSSLLPT